MINNRQAGRRRGRGGQRPGGGGGNGGGGQGGGGGAPNTGNRIDSRARGNANQLYEKYRNLAADSQRQGDRVTTEYYLQFADHYYRVLAETRPKFEEQQRQQRAREDQFDEYGDPVERFGNDQMPNDRSGSAGNDRDFGDEGDAIRPGEQMRGDQARDQGRDQHQGRDQQRDGGRDQQARGDGERRPYDDQRPRRDHEDRRPRRDQAERMNGQHRDAQADPSVPQQQAQPQPFVTSEPNLPLPEPVANPVLGDAQPPRRRGRPRKEPLEAPAALEADRLPPALGVGADAAGTDDAKPRRRRIARPTIVEAPAD